MQKTRILLSTRWRIYVNASSPGTNDGTKKTLRVDGSPVVNSYLRLTFQDWMVRPVSQARLLIYANSSTSQLSDRPICAGRNLVSKLTSTIAMLLPQVPYWLLHTGNRSRQMGYTGCDLLCDRGRQLQFRCFHRRSDRYQPLLPGRRECAPIGCQY